MPKILRIINRFNLGGPTYNVAYLTKYLAPEFETMLVGGMKDDSEGSSLHITRELGIEPVVIPEMKRSINPKDDWISYRKIRKLIEAFKPDIVHTHAAKAGTLGRLAAHHCNVPVIVHTFHGHVFHSYFGKIQTAIFKNIERYLAGKSTAIVAISEKQKEELTTIHKVVQPGKVTVIPLGFDLGRFAANQEAKRKRFRERYRLDDNEVAIGIIGRLVPVKNHQMFLYAIRQLMETTQTRFRAFIVGDGECKNEIEALAARLGINFREEGNKPLLHFTSWIKEVDEVYAGIDIVALTSFNEGTPVSLIEAQAAGKPVVSTRVGGIENVVMDKKTGLLSDLHRTDDFITNLQRMVANSELRKSYGEAGKLFISDKFSYSRLVSDMAGLYYRCLNNNG